MLNGKECPVNLELRGDELLYHARARRSGKSPKTEPPVGKVSLGWITSVSESGKVELTRGGCFSRARDERWAWALALDANGASALGLGSGNAQLVFSCETEEAMRFWVREVRLRVEAARAATKHFDLGYRGIQPEQIYSPSSRRPRFLKGPRGADSDSDDVDSPRSNGPVRSRHARHCSHPPPIHRHPPSLILGR